LSARVLTGATSFWGALDGVTHYSV
jgi:hypothetical protein